MERIEARLRNVQLALEVLTGVCATLPDVDVSGGDEGEVFFFSFFIFWWVYADMCFV